MCDIIVSNLARLVGVCRGEYSIVLPVVELTIKPLQFNYSHLD